MGKQRVRVLIAGAGIGGLTAALALLRRGFDVLVCEQACELGEVGAGLQLSPNGLRALYQLGLQAQLRKVASEPSGKEIRLWNTGQSWSLFNLGTSSVEQYGYPYFMMYRPDLHAILVNAVLRIKPDAILLNAKCDRFEQAEGKVAVALADGRTLSADVLVGADGVHSRIRTQLIGADQAKFSGFLAWRGVIPMQQLPDRLRRPVGANWVGPGAHVIHYPLHAGTLMNFVGIVERDDWRVESWTQRGSHEEIHMDFMGWHDDVHALINHIDVPYKWALMVREPLRRWAYGRVILLGDAAHPTLPFLAQGAAMAIEDGYVLGRCLDNPASGGPESALRSFERARIGRTTRIVQQSAANGQRFHSRELANAEGAAAYVDREWDEEKIRRRYDWLFSYDVDSVAVPLHLKIKESAKQP